MSCLASTLEVDNARSHCVWTAFHPPSCAQVPKGRDFFVTRQTATGERAAAAAVAAAAKDDGDGSEPALPPAKEYPVARIMVYTEHPDLIRRGGVISTLKNILFVKSAHELLLAPPALPEAGDSKGAVLAGAAYAVRSTPSAIDVLPNLLLPLCDGRELAKLDLEDQEALPDECQLMDEDKRRERDAALRLMLVESLLLLCTTLYGRQCLRARGAYIVVREAHLDEKDEKIAEAVVRLVNILKRDESESSVRDAQDGNGAIDDADVGAEAVAENEGRDEETDEDLVIEEL